MDAEYRDALSRVEAQRDANAPPLSPEQQRLVQQEEHERARREREAAAYAAESQRLHEQHVARADAAVEAERQRQEAARVAEAGERLRSDFFRRFPLATEDEFARALPRLLESEAADRIEQERRAMLQSAAYNRF